MCGVSVRITRLRYAFRLYPNAVQQTTLARAFGCARVLFNGHGRPRRHLTAQRRERTRPGPLHP
ncbi:helix-turn-helix domain-containing protein [Streptomyces himalayensis]|uniref:helix-turn-helix domain-containing protein n=1 Tax=Streptomyces himalayensis TaxID=2820085 RepID=UPI0035E4044D